MNCPNCGEDSPEDAKWCEACGQDLASAPLPACVSCGEQEVGPDGYCGSCGWKQPEERDHLEFRDRDVAAVTDRGKRHRHNEDSVAVGVGADGSAVLVVCDGVSSTPGSAEASLRAATTARDLLVAGLEDGLIDHESLLAKAAEAAQAEASLSTELESNAPYVQGGPPSSTFVATIATPTEDGVSLACGWIGDSRAYWTGSESVVLTEDHELGGSLTRWLGADSLDPTPDIRTSQHTGSGHVVVCSDGLWRYATTPAEMRDLVDRLLADGRLGPDLATAMVDHANESGGHDNISVALWTNDPDLRAPDEPDTETEPETEDNAESEPELESEPVPDTEAAADTDSVSTSADEDAPAPPEDPTIEEERRG